jgi:hypothetical protein
MPAPRRLARAPRGLWRGLHGDKCRFRAAPENKFVRLFGRLYFAPPDHQPGEFRNPRNRLPEKPKPN